MTQGTCAPGLPCGVGAVLHSGLHANPDGKAPSALTLLPFQVLCLYVGETVRQGGCTVREENCVLPLGSKAVTFPLSTPVRAATCQAWDTAANRTDGAPAPPTGEQASGPTPACSDGGAGGGRCSAVRTSAHEARGLSPEPGTKRALATPRLTEFPGKAVPLSLRSEHDTFP